MDIKVKIYKTIRIKKFHRWWIMYEFINAAGNSLADNKEYDVSYDLNTSI